MTQFDTVRNERLRKFNKNKGSEVSHRNGIQEVAGSIPASSIFYIKGLAIFAEPFLFGQYGCCIMGNDSVFITFEGFPL